MNIDSKIESKNYMATEHDVELLAAAHMANVEASKRTDGSYLRILVAALQGQFNGLKGRKRITAGDLKAHSEFLYATHTKFYTHVVKGVTTPDVMEDETLDPDTRRARAAVRNGRAAFARSAASTLQLFIRAGGDLRGVDVLSVTKTQLRTWSKAAMEPTPPADALLSAVKRLERDALAMVADEDPDVAREAVEGALERLQKILDGLDDPKQHTITQTLARRPVHTRQPAPAGRAHA